MRDEDMRDTIAIVEKDKEFTFKTAAKAHRSGEQALEGFHQASHQVVRLENMKPLTEFMNQTITETGCFGLAQALIQELDSLTQVLNKSLDKTKPFLGAVSPEHQAKAETLRNVIMANWLKTAFDELQNRNQEGES